MSLRPILEKLYKQHQSLVLYGLIGGMGALIDLIVFLVLFNALGVNPIIANLLSVSIGITNNFFLNLKFNFKVKDDLLHRFILFYGAGIAGLGVSILMLYIFSSALNIDANIVKIISIPIIVLGQYLFNSKVSFSDKTLKLITLKRFAVIIICLLLYLVFIKHATYFGFSDEYDNILGGWLISHRGTVLYQNLFSHHMPLPYFIGALITFFTDTDLNRFRIVYLTGLYIWLLFIAHRMSRSFGTKLALLFIALVGLTQYSTWTHMLLAESLIAYATIHMSVLLWDLWRSNKTIPLHRTIVASILCSIPALSSLSYLFLSLLLYVGFGLLVLRSYRSLENLKTAVKNIGLHISILVIPYVVLLGYLLVTGTLSLFVTDAYRFNQLYYSQFTPDVSGGIVQTLYNNFLNWLRDASHLLGLGPSQQSVAPVTILIFLSLIFLIVSLVISRKRVLATFAFGLIYFSSARTGTLSNFLLPQGNNRLSSVYISVALLLTVFSIHRLLSLSRSRETNAQQSLTTISGCFAILVVLGLGLQAFSLNDEIATVKRKGIETGLTQNVNGGQTAQVLNAVTDSKDYYWVGPFDFYSQIFVDANRSSQFTFFAPWQGVCSTCQQSILASFKQDKPTVIYYDSELRIFNRTTSSYFKPELEYINQNYYRYDSPQLKNFYFLKQDRLEIDHKLEAGGYL